MTAPVQGKPPGGLVPTDHWALGSAVNPGITITSQQRGASANRVEAVRKGGLMSVNQSHRCGITG